MYSKIHVHAHNLLRFDFVGPYLNGDIKFHDLKQS